MNKQLKIILTVVMCVSLTLIFICAQTYLDLGRRLTACNEQLTESRNNWEDIAARKETLQKELREKQTTLKETELTLEESTARVAELQQEVDELTEEIRQLKLSADNTDHL